MFDIGKELQKAYDEGYVRGVEDFAERLKARYCMFESYDFIYVDEIREDIDNLVKEMTEGKK